MRRAHIFFDFEFTDGTLRPLGPRPTGYGLSLGGDMGQRAQEYYEKWRPPSPYHAQHIKALDEYNPRRFRP